MANNVDRLKITGIIEGAGALLKAGDGTLILNGTSNYTGGTVVTAGTVIQIKSSALPKDHSLTIGAGAKLVYDPNGFDAGPMILSSPLAASPVLMSSPLNPVPEPSTLALLAAGLVVGFGAWRRKRKGLGIGEEGKK